MSRQVAVSSLSRNEQCENAGRKYPGTQNAVSGSEIPEKKSRVKENAERAVIQT